MRITLCFFWLYSLTALAAAAQPAFVRGQVTDAKTGDPLIGATIRAGETGTVTDYKGGFSMQLKAGTLEVRARYVGYQAFNETISLDPGDSLLLNIALKEQATVLETATVTSGKYQKPLSEVTVSLEVLRPNLIQSTGKTTMDQALEKVPGLTIIDGQANIRGGSGYSQGAGSRVLLLVDDIPILSADAGFPNWDDVPIENIAQVEVVKGAASALYGSAALNGIINVRTAYAKSEPETEGALWYTHFFSPEDERLKWWDSAPSTIGASLAHRRKMGKLDLVLGGYYLNEDSFNKDAYKRIGRFNFSTRYRASDRLTIGLNGNFNAGETSSFFYWKSDTAAYVGAEGSYGSRERLRFNIDPRLTYYDRGNNRHRILSRFYNIDNESDNDQGNASDMYYAEYQFQRQMKQAGLVLTSGIVAQGTNIEAELYGDTTFTSRNLAAYVQLEKRFFDRLNVTAGFRYEDNLLKNPGFQYDGGEVLPSEEQEARPVLRLGANYRLGKATFLRGSWGQGYRFPSVAEKYIVTDAGGLRIQPNPMLQSENGWSAEIGVKQGFRVSNFEGFLDFSLFQSRYFDMIEFNLVGLAFQSINVGDTDIRGLELTAAGQGEIWGVPLSLLAGYTYIDPRFEEFDIDAPIGTQARLNAVRSSSEENILKYRSQHLLKLDLMVEEERWSMGVEGFYNSHLEAIDNVLSFFVDGLARFREENDEGFFLVNFRASYNLWEEVKLSLLLNNAFNIEYSTRPGLLEAPRNVTMRMDFRF